MEANKIQVMDDQGNEIEFDVLFTFDNEDNGKKYVLYYNPDEEESSVYASIYDEEGKLFEIEDPKEWEMIEEVFQSFMAREEEGEDHQCCGGHHHHDDCCGNHEHKEEASFEEHEHHAGCDCKNES